MVRKKLSGFIRLLLLLLSLTVVCSGQATEPANIRKISVKIATLANFPPQYSLDDNGEPTGFAVDVMNQVADFANLAPVYIVFNSWPDAHQALRSGTVDIIPNMGITERRRAFADFTSPVETFPVSIFIRKAESGINDVQDLPGHKVAVVEVNVGYDLLKDRSDIDLVIAHNPFEAIMFLLSGQADALVFPQPVINQLAHMSGIGDKLKVVGEPLKGIVRAIAVRKGRDDLLGRLDAAVQQFVATKAYQRIYVRWYEETESYWTVGRLFNALGVMLGVLAVGMLIIRYTTLSRFNKTLEMRVQKRTAALTASEEHFRLLFENASFGIAVHDLVFDTRQTPVDYVFTDVNPAFYKILGLAPGSAIGRRATDLFAVPDAPYVEEFSTVALQGRPLDREVEFAPMGKVFKISAYSHRPKSFVTVFEDITVRKQAEATLKDLTHKLELAQELGRSGWWEYDIINGKVRWPDISYALFGLDPADTSLDYKRFLELIPPDYHDHYDAQLQKLFDDGLAEFQYPVTHPDGQTRWIWARGETEYDESGKPVRLFGILQDITDRKQNELQLQESQHRFQEIIDASPMPLSLSDDHGKILYINPAFVNTLGYTLEDIPTIDDFWPKGYPEPAYREEVMQEWWQRVTQSEKGLSSFVPMEVRICCKDGSTRTMLATSTLLSGFAEKTRLVTLYDITQNRIMSERLKTLLATASDGIHVMDEGGNIVEFSDSFARMLGYSVEEMARLNVADWEAQIARGELASTIRELLKQSSTFETKHRRKDGSIFDAEINAKGIVLDGRLLLYASSRDISERKKAENDLRYYETIVSSVDVLLALVDRDMVYLQVNDALARIIGKKREQIIGKPVQQIVAPDVFSKFEPQLKQSLAGETVSQEMWVPSPDGKKRLYRINRYPMYDEDGKVYAVAEVGHNMTDIHKAHEALTKANEELEQANESFKSAKQFAESANRAKSVFLSNMSHELRTPLNAILGYTQIFTADKTLGTKQQRGIQTIHRAGEHLLMIINDVLDMSKIEAGKLQLVPSSVELRPFFQHIIDFFKHRAREKGLTVTFEAAQSLPYAIAIDELRLRQVIFNLLSNAIKFTAKGTCRLLVDTVNMGEDRCLLTISVEDSGVGIPLDQQDEVFEPFKQVGERLQQKEGSGLGLAISEQLVNLMGGELILTSPANPPTANGGGAGSRFSFTIATRILQPAMAATAPSTGKIIGYEHTGDSNTPLKLLIVDDKISNRAVLRDTFQPLGFEIEEAENGLMISEICLKIHPDLILMDLRMPVVDGFSAMNQLKQHGKLRDVPVVAITASSAELATLRKRCLQHGFKGFIQKPFVTSELIETIAGLLPIKLIYEGAPEPKPDDLSDIEKPPAEYIAKLSESLSKGDIEEILEHAEAIGQLEDGKYQDFSRTIHQLANDFKFSELEKLISLKEDKNG